MNIIEIYKMILMKNESEVFLEIIFEYYKSSFKSKKK